VTIATLPGATLWHEGQFEGRRVRPPVFLDRRPDEAADTELAAWYRNLLARTGGYAVRAGMWQLLDAVGWPDNQSCEHLLAWCWTPEEWDNHARHVIVVNFSTAPAQGKIQLPWQDLPGRGWHLTDVLGTGEFDRDGEELAADGLYVDLGPGGFYVFAVE
jgi:hypothetical protein